MLDPASYRVGVCRDRHTKVVLWLLEGHGTPMHVVSVALSLVTWSHGLFRERAEKLAVSVVGYGIDYAENPWCIPKKG